MQYLHSLVRKHPLIRQSIAPVQWLRLRTFYRTQFHRSRILKDVLSDVLSGTLRVRVSGLPGEFELDVRSHILLRILTDKAYEPRLCRALRAELQENTGDAIDVGANVGLFTALLSDSMPQGARVLAIEPTPSALGYLERNISINGLRDRVAVFRGVASNEAGTVPMWTIPGKEEYSSIGGIVHPSVDGARESVRIEVQAKTLDRLADEHGLHPSVIKIDAEGSELLVLRGAARLLETCRPVIFSELSDALMASLGHSAKDVVNLLERADYDVRDFDTLEPIRCYPFDGEIVARPRVRRVTAQKDHPPRRCQPTE